MPVRWISTDSTFTIAEFRNGQDEKEALIIRMLRLLFDSHTTAKR